ncbi:ABC transporter ATP-binding protein, partial [Streptomyces sp. NPDC059479]
MGRDVLRRAVEGQRRDVVLASLLAAGHQAGEALVPVLIGLVIDRGGGAGEGGGRWVWLGVVGGFFLGLYMIFSD